jgi:hypothetical protein
LALNTNLSVASFKITTFYSHTFARERKREEESQHQHNEMLQSLILYCYEKGNMMMEEVQYSVEGGDDDDGPKKIEWRGVLPMGQQTMRYV